MIVKGDTLSSPFLVGVMKWFPSPKLQEGNPKELAHKVLGCPQERESGSCFSVPSQLAHKVRQSAGCCKGRSRTR